MNYYPNFATLLNHYLHQADDRSASWLARKLEMHPSTVNKWLNGNSRPRAPEVIIRIADILTVYDPTERQKLLHAAGYGYQMADNPVNLSESDALATAVPMIDSTVAIHKPAITAATALPQRPSLLLVGLASGVVLLYLILSKYLTIRSSAALQKL